MKKLKLTKNKYAIIDDEDFDFLNKWKWYLGADGYARRSYKESGKQCAVTMHRALLNPPKDKLVDHKNSNRCDNRRANLRICTRSQNAMNRKETKKNMSGYKGIYPMKNSTKNPWAAKIQVNGESIYLGMFPTKIEASKAYSDAAIIYHKEYARFTKI